MFRVPDDDEPDLFVGLNDDAVLIGRPQTLLDEAIVRYSDRTRSLAGNESFRRARTARAETMLFSYVDTDSAVARLEADRPDAERVAMQTLRRAVGMERVGPLGFSVDVSLARDTLEFALRAEEVAPDAINSHHHLDSAATD